MEASNKTARSKTKGGLIRFMPDLLLLAFLIILTIKGFSSLPAASHDVPHEVAQGHKAEPPLSSLIFPLVNFIIFVRILVYSYFKGILPALRQRQSSVTAFLSRGAQELDKAEQELSLAKSRLASLEAEKESLNQEILEQAKRLEDAIRSGAEKTLGDIQRDTQRRIAGEFSKTQAEIRAEIAVMASQLAKQVLERDLSVEDDARLRKETMIALRS